MTCYCIAAIDITDPTWIGRYVREVTTLVEQAGGRYLARTSQIRRLEGDRPLPQLVVVIEWPSSDQARAFYESEAYRPYRRSRNAGSKTEMILVESGDAAIGPEVTGSARQPF